MAKKIILGISISLIIIGFLLYFDSFQLNQSTVEDIQWFIKKARINPIEPTEKLIGLKDNTFVFDEKFYVQQYVKDIDNPTTMTFVGNDLLVLEKNLGNVKLIRDGLLYKDPVLHLEVSTALERGLLGITSIGSSVYLYYTNANQDDGDEIIQNYISKYTWDGKSLENPILLNVLPSHHFHHNGGVLASDQKGNVFAVIGDMSPLADPLEERGILQNNADGEFNDGGVIIRVGLDKAEFSSADYEDKIEHYYAMGIRNSFGLAIDPVTNNLWDTENGYFSFDEINLVSPKFNSGWAVTMGPTNPERISEIPPFKDFKYSDPEFSWEKTVAPTALVFVSSEKFEKYGDMLFVGDCNNGNIYKFLLNKDRTGFVFDDPNLKDLVVNELTTPDEENKTESMEEILFGTGFGCITDLEFGPDGSLYVVSISDGVIYQITPK